MSRCAGAGREHSEAASPGWYSIPWTSVYKWGLARGQRSMSYIIVYMYLYT